MDVYRTVRSTGRALAGSRCVRSAECDPRSDTWGDGRMPLASMATADLHVEEPISFVDGADHVFADCIASSTLSWNDCDTASTKAFAHGGVHNAGLDVDVKISDIDAKKPTLKRKFRTELKHSPLAHASDGGSDGVGFVSSTKKKFKSSGTPSTFTPVSRTNANYAVAARFSTEPKETVAKMSSAVVATDAEFERIGKRTFGSPKADMDRLRGPVGLLEAFASPSDAMTHDEIGVCCKSACPDSVGSCVIDTSSVSEAPGVLKQEMIEPCHVYSMGNDVVMELPKGGHSYRVPKTESSMSATVPIHKTANLAGCEVYELLFKTRDPLDFFCATTMDSDGSICYIRSVSPRVNDVRISSGTIIVATAMGKAGSNVMWHSVGSHYDLKKNYESYRRHSQGKWMQIRFNNAEVTQESKVIGSGDWTPTSAWQGDPTWEGWAGGAPEAYDVATKALTAPPPLPSRTASAALKQEENHDCLLGNAVAGLEDMDAQRQNSTVYDAGKPRGQRKSLRLHPVNRGNLVVDKQPKAILKTHSSLRKQPKSVSFQLGPGEDTFLISTAAGVMHTSVPTSSSTKSKVQDIVSKSCPSNDDLLLAIAHQSYIDVLKLLQAGAIPRPKDVKQRYLPDFVAKGIKDGLERENKRKPSPELEAKCKDSALKVSVLRIFHTVRSAMIASSFFKNWVGYEVSILDIENFKLNSVVPISKSDKFCCHIKIQGKDICSFECGLAEWTNAKVKKGCYYLNESLPVHWEGSEKTFNVTFTRTYGRDQCTVVLASQKVHLDVFKNRTGLKKAMTVVMPKTEDLESGQVIIKLLQLGATTRAQIAKQQERCRKKLNEIITDVKLFNNH